MTLEYQTQGDLQYPVLEDIEVTVEYGAYGMQRRKFLEENRPAEFLAMMVDGELEQYCQMVDRECSSLEQLLIRQMKQKRGVDEAMKSKDQIRWIREMNAIRVVAKEEVLNRMIYR